MKTVRAEGRYGPMFVFDNDMVIGRSLLKYGEWAELEIDLLSQIVKPGSTVVDVGANIGTHTVPFAQMVGPGGKVIAFEPQHLVFQLLCANVAVNDLHNVWANNAAVGARDGFCEMTALDFNAETNNFGACEMRTPEHKGKVFFGVPIVRLDLLDLEACALIKADVEGGELDMLRGAEKTIERCQPVLYLEHHDNRDEVVAFLRERGYRIHMHRTPSFNKKNFNGVVEDLFDGYAEDNIVCFPRHVEVNFATVNQ